MHELYNFKNHGEYFRSKDYLLKNSISIRLPTLTLAVLKEANRHDPVNVFMTENDVRRKRSHGDSGGSLRNSSGRSDWKAPESEVLSELVLERPVIDIEMFLNHQKMVRVRIGKMASYFRFEG
jgi:hypothetical protein